MPLKNGLKKLPRHNIFTSRCSCRFRAAAAAEAGGGWLPRAAAELPRGPRAAAPRDRPGPLPSSSSSSSSSSSLFFFFFFFRPPPPLFPRWSGGPIFTFDLPGRRSVRKLRSALYSTSLRRHKRMKPILKQIPPSGKPPPARSQCGVGG